MLVELSVVEQGYQAVLAVIRDGVSIVQVALRFGVSRQAVHRWLRWFEDQELEGLVDRSHRLPRCSHQMAPALGETALMDSLAARILRSPIRPFDPGNETTEIGPIGVDAPE